MPDCFVESPSNGMVLDFNGIDPVIRWDGITATYETAGLTAPVTQPQIGGSGSGPIVGKFKCYVRFVDRYGVLSNTSPLSAEFEPSVTVGTVSNATNASPIVITSSGAHGLSTGQIVKISDIYGNENANGIWKVKVLSTTTFELTGSVGSGAYNSNGVIRTGVSKIQYSNVEVPTDAKVTRRQILRNRDGSYGTFYVDIDTTDLTSTAFESVADSASLAGAPEVPITDLVGTDQAILRYSKPPSHYSAACYQGGRLFAAVIEPYSEGCVSVTNGSTAVTGIATEWNMTSFVGRYFQVVGDTVRYKITSLTSLTALVLDTAYAGTTDPFARYVISPEVTRHRSFDWSETFLPEAWPPANSHTIPGDTGAGAITGITANRSWVYILCEYWLYRFSWFKSPGQDGDTKLAWNRGCVNNRCCVVVGDQSLMLDYYGVHAYSGNYDENISDEIGDLFRPTPNGTFRINWKAKKTFHGAQDPTLGLIYWFVCLDGDYTPRHALVYDIVNKRWAVFESVLPIGASSLGLLDNRPQLYLGTTAKRVLAANTGTLDGPSLGSGTLQGTVTDSGPGWIADSGATFPSAGVVGFPVSIYEGTGRGQMRTVYSVSGTTVYVRPLWNVKPDTTSKYILGGIPWRHITGQFQWAESPVGIARGIEIYFRKLSAAAGLSLQLFDDTQDAALVASETKSKDDGDGLGSTKDLSYLDIDVTRQVGRVNVGLNTFSPSEAVNAGLVQLKISGVQSAERQELQSYTIRGASPP